MSLAVRLSTKISTLLSMFKPSQNYGYFSGKFVKDKRLVHLHIYIDTMKTTGMHFVLVKPLLNVTTKTFTIEILTSIANKTENSNQLGIIRVCLD